MQIIIDNSDSEVSSVEEFEDASESFTADDDIFVDNIQSKRLEPLSKSNYYNILKFDTLLTPCLFSPR